MMQENEFNEEIREAHNQLVRERLVKATANPDSLIPWEKAKEILNFEEPSQASALD